MVPKWLITDPKIEIEFSLDQSNLESESVSKVLRSIKILEKTSSSSLNAEYGMIFNYKC